MEKNEEKLERQITQLSEQNDKLERRNTQLSGQNEKLQTTLLEGIKPRVIAPEQLREGEPSPSENKE